MNRLGIYGGTFNPPHIGHIHAALAAKDELELSKVIFIPANLPPHKMLPYGSASARQRYEMVCTAVSSYQWAEVSRIEIEQEQKNYTANTLLTLKKSYPDAELWLIIGTDMLMTLDKWYRPDIIMENANIAAVGREYGDDALLDAAKKKLQYEFNTKIKLVHAKPIPISSTELRQLLKQSRGEEFLPHGVYDYILQNGLYKAGGRV